MLPALSPLQLIFICEPMLNDKAVGSDMTTGVLTVQALASLVVKV